MNHWMEFLDNRLAQTLFGEYDNHLKLIEERLGVSCHPRGNALVIIGGQSELEKARRLLEDLYGILERGQSVDRQRVEDSIRALEDQIPITDLITEELTLRTPRRLVQPRNMAQAEFIRLLVRNEMNLSIGPAGTGKTYLAVAVAVLDLLEGKVTKIILTRPAVEAGERLGFLPGDLQEKVDPYLRPLYDALAEMVGMDKVERMMQQGVMEVAPLAYMRGRTLRDAFIILDEAQNTTTEQMKMFLTRFGEGSRMAVVGDITQIDLPRGQQSGLVQAWRLLRGIEGIGFHAFTERDVVRHPLVRRIVQAYRLAEHHEAADSIADFGGGG